MDPMSLFTAFGISQMRLRYTDDRQNSGEEGSAIYALVGAANNSMFAGQPIEHKSRNEAEFGGTRYGSEQPLLLLALDSLVRRWFASEGREQG